MCIHTWSHSTTNSLVEDQLINYIDKIREKTRICFFFANHLSHLTLLDLELSAKNFGQSERHSITRLVAKHRIQSYQQDIKDVDCFEKNLHTLYGCSINTDLLQVYLAFEFGKIWGSSQDIAWLNRCVLTVGIISSVNLRNTVVLATFFQFFGTKLENIIDIVEKARRVPKDTICIRMCGLDGKFNSLNFSFKKIVTTIKVFLDLCLSLLEFLTIDSYSTRSYMLGSIEQVLEMNSESLENSKNILFPKFNKKIYFNDALGTMIDMLNQVKADRQLYLLSFMMPLIVNFSLMN